MLRVDDGHVTRSAVVPLAVIIQLTLVQKYRAKNTVESAKLLQLERSILLLIKSYMFNFLRETRENKIVLLDRLLEK